MNDQFVRFRILINIDRQSNQLFPSFNRAYNLFVYFWPIDQSSPNANAALRSREAIRAEYRCARVFSLRPLPASMWIEIAFQPNRGEPTLSHSIRCRVSRSPQALSPPPLLYPFGDLPTYLPTCFPTERSKSRDNSR